MTSEYVTHWTAFEGGTWLSISQVPPVPKDQQLLNAQAASKLEASKYGAGKVTTLFKRKIHSFKTSTGREWDVLNGWRPAHLWAINMEKVK